MDLWGNDSFCGRIQPYLRSKIFCRCDVYQSIIITVCEIEYRTHRILLINFLSIRVSVVEILIPLENSQRTVQTCSIHRNEG